MSENSPLHFHPTARYWRSFILSNLFLLAFCGLMIYQTGWVWNRPVTSIIFVGLSLFLLWRLTTNALQSYRSRVEITDNAIHYCLYGQSGTIVYDDVQAYYTYHQKGSPPKEWLVLTLLECEISIPAELFNIDTIHGALKNRIPATAQQPDSLLQSDFYQQQQWQTEQWRGAAAAITVRAYPWWVVLLMAGGILLFLGVIFANSVTLSTRTLPLIACMVSFVLLFLYAFALNGTISADSIKIRYTSMLAQDEILWDEVQRIEFDLNGQYCILVGQDKWVALPGVMYWSGKHKQRFANFMEYETARRNIEVKRCMMLFKFSKNTRVSASKSKQII
jgi:hypothetical protein